MCEYVAQDNSAHLRMGVPIALDKLFTEHLRLPENPSIPDGELHISGPVYAQFEKQLVLKPRQTVTLPLTGISEGARYLLTLQETLFNLRSKLAHGLMDADRCFRLDPDGNILIQLTNHHPHTQYVFNGEVDMGRLIAPGRELVGDDLMELGQLIGIDDYVCDARLPRLLKIAVDHVYFQSGNPPDMLTVNDIPSPRNRENLYRTFNIHPVPIDSAQDTVSHTALQIYGTQPITLPEGKGLLIVGGVNGGFYDQHTSAALFETAKWTLDAEIYKNDARPTTHLAFAGYNLQVLD